jgi:hypothetical protein
VSRTKMLSLPSSLSGEGTTTFVISGSGGGCGERLQRRRRGGEQRWLLCFLNFDVWQGGRLSGWPFCSRHIPDFYFKTVLWSPPTSTLETSPSPSSSVVFSALVGAPMLFGGASGCFHIISIISIIGRCCCCGVLRCIGHQQSATV